MKKSLARVASWWRTTIDPDIILKDYKCSKEFECSFRGFPSTPSTDNITDIYESIAGINHLPLHYDAIKLSLEELSRFSCSKFPFPSEIEWHHLQPAEIKELFSSAGDLEINVAFLWAAFLRRFDLLQVLLELGAQPSFFEHNYGLSALHLAAFSGCTKSADFLLSQKGCYVNLMCKCYSPLHCSAFGDNPDVSATLLEKGANIDAFTNDLHCNIEGVLHCAVRANAVQCLKLFCDKGANISQVDSSGRTPIHLAAELGHTECLRMLVNSKGANVDQQTKEKQQTPLHLAAQNGHLECIDLLLDHEASPNITDYRLHTPLHLAAKSQCNECVKLLLRKGKASPNVPDNLSRTPLHLVVSRPSRVNCSDTIRILIRYGAEINAKDSNGFTPLHLAASNELSECVETLIGLNADITSKCKPGITALGLICRKTPSGIDAIRKRLDEAVAFSYRDSCTAKESELEIDFGVLLQYGHPKEIQFLNTLLEEGQKDLLLHPVCTAFLHLKWKKIRKFFVFRATFCFLLVLCMSAYVLTGLAKHCYNVSKNVTLTTYEEDRDLCLNHSYSGRFVVAHPYIVEVQWYLMVILSIVIIVRKICALPGYTSVSQYLTLQNFLDWSTILTVYLISFVYTGRNYLWQNHVSAFGVLIAWANFLNILAQFPFFGTYFSMYTSVQREFAKLLLVFSCLLIGFTISFCVLFPNSEVFSSIYIGFITVLVMGIGEMNLDLLTNPSKEDEVFMLRGSMEVIYATFVTCVTIILLNLLVGIAVHDIQGLKKTARLAKLTKATEVISCIERALFTDYFHRKILAEFFRWSTLVSTKGYCVVTVKVHNHGGGILPSDIINAAYDVARKHKKKNRNFKKMCYQNSQRSLLNVKDQLKKSCNNSCVGKECGLQELRNDMKNLHNEMLTLKDVIESNQRLMEQMMRLMNAADE